MTFIASAEANFWIPGFAENDASLRLAISLMSETYQARALTAMGKAMVVLFDTLGSSFFGVL